MNKGMKIVGIDVASGLEFEIKNFSVTSVEYMNPADFCVDMQGWYIISRDLDGNVYDAIGPYETEEKAQHVRQQTRSE